MRSRAFEENPYIDSFYQLLDRESDVMCLTANRGVQAYFEASVSRVSQNFITLPESISAAVSFCAGLALEGFKPYLHASAAQLSRGGYESALNHISSLNLPVRLIGLDPALYHEGGVSGQGIDDFALFSNLPNFTLAEAGDVEELKTGLELLHPLNGPVYFRIPLSTAPRLFDGPPSLTQPRVVYEEGDDILMISMGICSTEIMRVTEALKQARIKFTHLHLFALKPLPKTALLSYLEKRYKGVITVENHLSQGGLGSHVSTLIHQAYNNEKHPHFIMLGLQDTFAQGGRMPYLMKKYGIDSSSIIAAVETIMKRRLGISTADLPPSPWKMRSQLTFPI
jgi:transketolase